MKEERDRKAELVREIVLDLSRSKALIAPPREICGYRESSLLRFDIDPKGGNRS